MFAHLQSMHPPTLQIPPRPYALQNRPAAIGHVQRYSNVPPKVVAAHVPPMFPFWHRYEKTGKHSVQGPMKRFDGHKPRVCIPPRVEKIKPHGFAAFP